jgi:hypothetical protein
MLIAIGCTIYCFAAWWAYRSIRTANPFLNPIFLPIIIWTANYPVRAILVARDATALRDNAIADLPDIEHYLLGVLYAAFFLLILGVTLRAFLPHKARVLSPIDFHGSPHFSLLARERFVIHFSIACYFVAFAYQLTNIGVTSLYEDFEQLQKTRLEILVGEIIALKWFFATASALAFFLSKRRAFLIETILIAVSIIVTATISTSKGQFMNLAVLSMMLLAIIGRRVNYLLMSLLAVFGFLIGVYSYEIRENAYFIIRGLDSSGDSARTVYEIIVNKSPIEVIEKHAVSVIDRFSYYGDALGLMISGRVDHSNQMYMLGSLVEFGNLIPRGVWEDRPHLSFNHHVTSAVWGLTGLLSETPIGRIGEAFYVANWWGVLFAIVYGILFGLLAIQWHSARRSILGAAAWVAALLGWAVPDAYLLYGLKQILVIGFVFFILNSFTGRRIRLFRAYRCHGPGTRIDAS